MSEKEVLPLEQKTKQQELPTWAGVLIIGGCCIIIVLGLMFGKGMPQISDRIAEIFKSLCTIVPVDVDSNYNIGLIIWFILCCCCSILSIVTTHIILDEISSEQEEQEVEQQPWFKIAISAGILILCFGFTDYIATKSRSYLYEGQILMKNLDIKTQLKLRSIPKVGFGGSLGMLSEGWRKEGVVQTMAREGFRICGKGLELLPATDTGLFKAWSICVLMCFVGILLGSIMIEPIYQKSVSDDDQTPTNVLNHVLIHAICWCIVAIYAWFSAGSIFDYLYISKVYEIAPEIGSILWFQQRETSVRNR